MKGMTALVRRNCKLFFKDKGMFFTAMITPIILLVLYMTFLSNVYEQTFRSALPASLEIDDKLISAMVGGQLVSSLLAVCTVTIAFCSGLLMVQDRVNESVQDLTMTPVSRATLGLSYFVSTAISTLIVSLVATCAGLLYLGAVGWYLSVGDVVSLVCDVVLLVMFGTALSSIVTFPLSTQGQASAVGTIVSAGYGFICGAYMPISSFADGLQKALSFLPGTYGTVLLRNHTLGGVFAEMERIGFPDDVVDVLRDSIDCNLYFFSSRVSIGTMYAVLGGAMILLVGLYVALNLIKKRR